MGGSVPKQYLRIGGVPILCLTIELFERVRSVRDIVLVVPKAYAAKTEALARKGGYQKVKQVVSGGRARQDSVRRGLEKIDRSIDIVLVHDAVRPFVREATVRAVIREAHSVRAAIVGVPVKDTIKVEGRTGFFTSTLHRDTLWAVQTPQGFHRPVLEYAHEKARSDHFTGTDEASLVLRINHPVSWIEGEVTNFKITVPADLELAEAVLRTRGLGEGKA